MDNEKLSVIARENIHTWSRNWIAEVIKSHELALIERIEKIGLNR